MHRKSSPTQRGRGVQALLSGHQACHRQLDWQHSALQQTEVRDEFQRALLHLQQLLKQVGALALKGKGRTSGGSCVSDAASQTKPQAQHLQMDF
mmetsp:Transcript_118787/g.193312  ORF Transcript_118787/g.193312 Transcript_118787/m.193312 type:complete len:94 (-) Transcript_118787:27-308(-)